MNKKQKVEAAKKKPCSICKKVHEKGAEIGESTGSGTKLAYSIAGGSSKVQTYKRGHALSVCVDTGRKSTKDNAIIDPQLEAHHLICSESMDDSPGRPGGCSWEDICNSFGYDINDKENGVFLPNTLESACANRVPLHRGDHEATSADYYRTNYVLAVKDLIDPIKRRATEFCKDSKGLKKELDKISKEIFSYVRKFAWTITADGRDYKGNIGCYNCSDFDEKRAKMVDEIKNNISDANLPKSSDSASDTQEILTSYILNNLERCCNPLNHSDPRFKRRKRYKLKISK